MPQVRRWINTMLLSASCIVLAAGGLTSCTGEQSADAGFDAKMPKKKITLKVAGYERQPFMTTFGYKFQLLYPNVSFSFNERKDKSLVELIPEFGPDIVITKDLEEYGELALGGFLESLDGVILKEKIDTDSMVPGVVRSLKEKSDGALYGLAPWFKSSALYYNSTLFEEKGIPLPEGAMSWENVLQLADRLANHKQGEEATYGFAPDDSWTALLQTIGWSYGIQLANVKARQMTIDTDQWRSIIKMLTDAIRSGGVPLPTPIAADMQKHFEESTFMQGQTGMTIDDQVEISIPERFTLRGGKFMTGIAPLPVGDRANAISPIQPGAILSVAAGSVQQRAAWEFVKFATGKDWAKQKGMTWDGVLLSRSAEQQDPRNLGISTFHQGLEDMRPRTEKPLPLGFAQAFELKLIELLKQVAEDKLSVSDAVAQLQVEGQQLIG